MNRTMCTLAALLVTGVIPIAAAPAQGQRAPGRPAVSQATKVQGKAMRPEMHYLRGVESLTLPAVQKRALVAHRAAAKAALRRE